ncbi:MAG: glucosamine-6-phosphate deaminase [Streptococcaceae bacterium]|jgi:glucosamine-6-phosphate deaminase|nr:glucosamine-6-phosphate deaminase [Streptococcaceae bacterium]
MKIIKVNDKYEGSKKAFKIIEEVHLNGARVFGLATGSSPLELYKELRESSIDFTDSISINLDEYIGLSKDDKQSYWTFMCQQLFSVKSFKKSYIPNGRAKDLAAEAKRYDEIIQQYPIDLQILGIGNNGHIGFNEPKTPFSSTTHIVELTDSTIEANRRFFAEKEAVPTKAISMGIKSIMSAQKILLLAWGKAKAEAIEAMVKGPIVEDMPASILQKHQDVVFILDKAAGSKL